MKQICPCKYCKEIPKVHPWRANMWYIKCDKDACKSMRILFGTSKEDVIIRWNEANK